MRVVKFNRRRTSSASGKSAESSVPKTNYANRKLASGRVPTHHRDFLTTHPTLSHIPTTAGTMPNPLTLHEALSGIFGTISLTAWLFLLLPQLQENYSQGHANGISLSFLLLWAAGDVANLVGAVWAGLVPTVIALAGYFCVADTVLILQVLYYRAREGRAETVKGVEGEGERQALLGEDARKRRGSFMDVTDENLGLPGSRTHKRRRSSAASTTSSAPKHDTTGTATDTLTPIPEQTAPTPVPTPSPRSSALRETLKNTLAILAITLLGTAAWAFAYRLRIWSPVPPPDQIPNKPNNTPLPATLLGYTSAALYLLARIPQLIKNHRTRSCAGLSLLFFLLSLLGNISYGAGILAHSLDRGYVIMNAPWLVGSLGTVVQDLGVWGQFVYFGAGDGGGKEEGGEEEVGRGAV